MKDNNFVNLGKRIREKRLSQNLTQEALAEKADVGTAGSTAGYRSRKGFL